jgi:hypothetical protein
VTCLAQPSSIHAGFLAGKSAERSGSSYPMVSDTSRPGMRWRSLHCAAVLLLAVQPQVIVRLQTGKTRGIVWSLTDLAGGLITPRSSPRCRPLGLLAAHAADTSAIGVSRRAARRPGHHKTGLLAVASTMTKILDQANATGCAFPARESRKCNNNERCSGPWQLHPRYLRGGSRARIFCSRTRAGAGGTLRLKDGENPREDSSPTTAYPASPATAHVTWSLTKEPVMGGRAWIIPGRAAGVIANMLIPA